MKTLENEKQLLGTEETPEPDPFIDCLEPLGEGSSQRATDILGCATEKPTTSSVQPQDSSDSKEAKTRLLLNTSRSQVAFLAEELKRLKMDSTRVAATLMKKEKAQDQEVERWIRREEAVKDAQEKKEQTYVDRIKHVEADLKQVLDESKAEQRR